MPPRTRLAGEVVRAGAYLGERGSITAPDRGETLSTQQHAQDRLLTLDDISERTHMPKETLRYKRYRGEMPFIFRLGRRLVAFETELDSWIRAQRQTTSQS